MQHVGLLQIKIYYGIKVVSPRLTICVQFLEEALLSPQTKEAGKLSEPQIHIGNQFAVFTELQTCGGYAEIELAHKNCISTSDNAFNFVK